jgi:hypothetical protein
MADKPVEPPWMQHALEMQAGVKPGEAMDEPMGGKTLQGTSVTPRVPACFPAEGRDLFWQMDMVPDSTTNKTLHPLNFDINNDGRIDDQERNAIRGRNTWVMWCGGNEGFWDWLSQNGYGITDFLILLDSRNRGQRFDRAGLINQPGFKSNSKKSILGLYLDAPEEGGKQVLAAPPWEKAQTRYHAPHPDYELFKVGDPQLYKAAIQQLEETGDGVDYSVYGFPSGVVGLRLFPNPDFFGKGNVPNAARARWKERVQDKTDDSYYTDPNINQDPKLIRPFRVGMSCGFCHVGPHPLNPPRNFEAPEWANLSTTIGNQFWNPQPAFAVLLKTNNFLHHFLASQQPGTIDTSLVSSDQINNANTINALFNVNARLARATLNATERQSPANVLVRSIEDAGLPVKGDGTDWRHTPRVLLDGSDSIGVFGALARVYLNIGTFYEEWALCDNLVIGFRKQRPFKLEVCQRNSVYWLTNERYRADYLAAFFTMAYAGGLPTNAVCPAPHASTQPMKLAAAKDGDGHTMSAAAQSALALDSSTNRIHGRKVWLSNCAICHSSKQPDGFELTFERKTHGEQWFEQSAPSQPKYVLPMDAADWDAYKRSPSYQHYLACLSSLVDRASLDNDPLIDDHPFWRDNYLATDIRVPVTLAGTPSGRAMASNGIKGHIWDNFSSDTYKELPSVGPVIYFDPITGREATYEAPGGGRGYYRPATLVSLWATAPFLHNNALGVYLKDPSVQGRLVQFSDAIRRLLWKDKRAQPTLLLSEKEWGWLNTNSLPGAPRWTSTNSYRRPGDLRASAAFASDTGFIYRIPNDTHIEIAPGFVRQLVHGLAGNFLTAVLTTWLWLALALLAAWLAWKAAPRYLGIVLIGLALLLLLPLAVSGMGGRGSGLGVLLMEAASFVPLTLWGWRIVVLTFVLAGVTSIEARPDRSPLTANRVVVTLVGGIGLAFLLSQVYWLALILLFASLALAVTLRFFERRWTLSLLSRTFFVLSTIVAVLGGIATNRFVNGRPLLSIPALHVKVGPTALRFGPIPKGTPVNLIMNMDPDSADLPAALAATALAVAEIKHKELTGEEAWRLFSMRAGKQLMAASKCPDFTLDRGHYFGETLDPDPQKNEQAKEDLIAFLKTL